MTNLTQGTHKCHHVHIIISANKSIYVSFTSMTCLHRGPLACLQEGLATYTKGHQAIHGAGSLPTPWAGDLLYMKG